MPTNPHTDQTMNLGDAVPGKENSMTKQEAYEYVISLGDEDADEHTVDEAFEAVYGRAPDDDDGSTYDRYSLVCAGLAAEGYDINGRAPDDDPVRLYRAYTLHYESEDGCDGERHITIPAGTEDEQDAAAWEAAEEAAAAWMREGEWGDDGATVWARYWWEDADYDTRDHARIVDVEIEPDHNRLVAAAGGDTDCEHDWTSDGEGGLAENPGVWSRGGTTMTYAAHCRRCGLHRVETCYGAQRPGQSDKTEYRQMDDDEIAAHRANGTMDAPAAD